MTTLYLVDDHAMMREGLCALLEAAGFKILGEAGSVESAVANIARLGPDIVLLDLSLGERSGLEVLAQLRRRKLRSRALVLTMYAQPRHVSEARRLGAAGYVLKGSHGYELVDAIREVAAGRQHWAASVAEALSDAAAATTDTSKLDTLSPRERQIMNLVVRGRSSAQIAEAMHLSPKSIATYRSRLMQKLELRDVPALVRLAVQQGLLGD